MKLVYNQPYTKKRNTKCWYGKPPKGVFKYDVIKLELPDKSCKHCGNFIFITPDEASDFIRALSAGLHHFLVDDKAVKHIIEAKSQCKI
jgi:hypothetical protein